MAQRRMFSIKIVDSDAFLDMPQSSQNLYFHLGMHSDDDGFVNPKKIMRVIGSQEDDLKVLIAKRFILPFENGVVVIKHWLINNLIRKDFYQETIYLEQKNMLQIKDNKSYTEACQQNVDNLAPQVRLGKVRIGKDKEEDVAGATFQSFWKEYPKKELKKKSSQIWQRKKLEQHLPVILDFIKKARETDRWQKGYIKQPPAFLNGECWNDDLSAYNDKKTNQSGLDLRIKK